MITPDHGSLAVDGQPVTIRNPMDARRYGIETVYQDLAVVPYLDVEANLFLGRELTGKSWWNGWLLDKKAMRAEAMRHVSSLQIGLRSVRHPVGLLSGGQRQGVAVARSISWGRKIVIMDEPTAALGVKESRGVLELIKRVRDRGISVILISHNMPHVFEVTDRIFVLRHGRHAGTLHTREASMNNVVSLITGVDVQAAHAFIDKVPPPAQTRR
ncbi:MAG: hypothetical protein NVSMB65_07520 [Chloroflexota bacterium]